MYQGSRDPMTGIIVRQELCYGFTDKALTEWVEIFVPPLYSGAYMTPWSSIALPPSQVFCHDGIYNEIFVNAGANLSCLFKQHNNVGERRIVGKEIDSVEHIWVRFLNYEYYRLTGSVLVNNNSGADALYADWRRSGMTMHGYLNCLMAMYAADLPETRPYS